MNRERSGGAIVVSVVLHILLVAALVWVVGLPAPLRQWLSPRAPEAQHAERIGFFGVSAPVTNPNMRAGGNGRPTKGTPRTPPELTAPLTIPSAVPVTMPGAPAVPEEGTGPVISAGGAGPGIMPQLHDPRVWLPPSAVILVPKPEYVRLDSALHEALNIFRDSAAAKRAAEGALASTFTAGGKKYGVDQNNIYIADFKIPAALLAFLPIRPTGYPTADQTNLARQSMDINYHAGQALDAEDFRTAVKRIRERKDREKRAREIAAGKTPTVAASADPPPKHTEARADPIALQTP